MIEDKVTPEEKLLKVIENPADIKEKATVGIKKSPKGSLLFKKRWQGLEKDKIKALISLKNAYKTLMVTSVLMTILVTYIFVKGYNDSKRRFKNIENVPSAGMEKEKQRYTLAVNLTEAIKDSRKRNIFTSLPTKLEGVIPTETEQTITNLKLVGIIWSDNPQAMIEDIKANKTFLLSINETIGIFKIKNILRDKVVIGKDDQEWELR